MHAYEYSLIPFDIIPIISTSGTGVARRRSSRSLRPPAAAGGPGAAAEATCTANLYTKILDFGRFDTIDQSMRRHVFELLQPLLTHRLVHCCRASPRSPQPSESLPEVYLASADVSLLSHTDLSTVAEHVPEASSHPKVYLASADNPLEQKDNGFRSACLVASVMCNQNQSEMLHSGRTQHARTRT